MASADRWVRRSWGTAALGYTLVVLAWAVGNAPFAAPDEVAQYTRAAAFARGQLGAEPDYPVAPATFDQAWYRRLTRVVQLPQDMVYPRSLPCFAFRRTVTPRCVDDDANASPWALDADARLALDIRAPSVGTPLEAMLASLDVVGQPGRARLVTTTYVGVYPPFLLLPAGVVANGAAAAGTDAEGALVGGRIATSIVCAMLLASGLWALLAGVTVVGPRLLGASLALTPMAVFGFSTVSTSGPEIAGGFAVACAAARLSRSRVPDRGGWAVLGVAGATMALSRQAGPAWIALWVSLAYALLGQRVREVVAGRAARVAGAAIGVAAAGMAAWNLWVMPPAPERSVDSLSSRIDLATQDLVRLGREAVGVFGWLDVGLPKVLYFGWAALVVALIAVAFATGPPRLRVLPLVLVVLAVGSAYAFSVLVAYPIGAGAQGRWLLPFAVSIPIFAGESLARSGSRLVRAPVLGLGVAAVVVAHFVSFWMNARRYAVGDQGPLQFLGESVWAPAGGWVPPFVLLAAGLGLVVLAWIMVLQGDARVHGSRSADFAVS